MKKKRCWKRKLSALILSLIIMLPSIVSVQAAYFSDIPISHWARNSINFASDNGYMSGTSGTKFSPDANMTRAMTAIMLYRMAGSPSVTITTQFTDVSSTAAYAKAVSWVYSKSIMGGTTSTTFEPNTAIKRQDIVVVLYKFAQFKNYDTSDTNSLSQFTDTNQIYSYALTPMKWAVGVGLIKGDSATTLAPRSIVSRSICAEILKRFGTHVEGIIKNRDIYSFGSGGFYSNTYGSYYMSSSDYSNLDYYLSQYCTSYQTTINSINNAKNSNFYDPNFGILTTIMLDKFGQVDINGNYGTSSNDTMFSLGRPKNNLPLESAINFYVMTQYIPGVVGRKFSNEHTFIGAKNLLNKVKEEGLAVFEYDYNDAQGTHTCLALGYDYTENSDGTFSVKIYDVDISDQLDMSLVMNANQTVAEIHYAGYTGYDTVEAISYVDPSKYDIYDVDSYYNNMASASASSLASTMAIPEAENTTYLTVTLEGEFEIKNAEGESIVYKNGALSGTMERLSEIPIAKGRNAAAEVMIEVNNSENFTYTSNKTNNKFYVLNNSVYSGAEGINIDSVTVDMDGNVDLTGTNMDYKAVTSPLNNYADMISLTGSGDNEVSISEAINGTVIDGISGNYELNVFGDQITPDTYSFNTSTGSVLIGANSPLNLASGHLLSVSFDKGILISDINS